MNNDCQRDDAKVLSSIISPSTLVYKLAHEFALNADVLSCQLWHRGVHDTYRIKTHLGERFLKVYRSNIRKRSEVQSEIELTRVLADAGLPVSVPFKTKDGNDLFCINAPEGPRCCVLFSLAEGRALSGDNNDDRINILLGKCIAEIHTHWDSYDNDFDRWRLDHVQLIEKPIEMLNNKSAWFEADLDYVNEIAQAIVPKLANSFPLSKPEFGLCHGDFYLGNICFAEDGAPTLFDFDFCGLGWRVYDISLYVSAYGWGCEPKMVEKRERRKESFIKGYSEVRTMSDWELSSIEFFTVCRRIFNLGYIYSQFSDLWGGDTLKLNVTGELRLLKEWIEFYEPL
ncbi:MAG: phosphotransferase [Planctomycetes bacterium]|nr:phosphotransferase [Planctomycetota bacterium]